MPSEECASDFGALLSAINDTLVDYIRICKGVITFTDDIAVTQDRKFTVACKGPQGTCIFNLNGHNIKTDKVKLEWTTFKKIVFRGGRSVSCGKNVA